MGKQQILTAIMVLFICQPIVVLANDNPFDKGANINIGSDNEWLIKDKTATRSGSDSGDFYHLFYDQGSTFWFELDNLILDCTQGKKNLDNFIGEFSEMNFPDSYSLPREFIDILNSHNIKGIESLMEKYL